MNEIKTQEKELNLERQTIETLLEKKEESLNINIIFQEKTRYEIQQKLMSAGNLFKPRNTQIDPRNIPKGVQVGNSTIGFEDLEPTDPTTLPAEISTEIRAAGISNIAWSDTRDLPRGMDQQIRSLEQHIFKNFGIKENSSIKTISSLKNSDLLNTRMEMNSVLGFLEKNAEKEFAEPATQIFFGQTEYSPLLQIYTTNNMAYLVVSEPEGHGIEGDYIYAFEREEKPQLNQQNKISNQKRLKNR